MAEVAAANGYLLTLAPSSRDPDGCSPVATGRSRHPGGRSPGGSGCAFCGRTGQSANDSACQFAIESHAPEDGGTGGRSNDGDTKMMRDLAIRLTDGEIEAVASYIAGLH